MIPATFEYKRASSLDEVLALLASNAEAKILAGGHSLIPAMKLRLAEPSLLIDIGGLRELAGIRVDGARITVGALTTHAEIAASDELRRRAPALWDAANDVGDAQVRNRGTLGGALAHADPACDYAAVVLALDATMSVTGKGGKRDIKAADFFLGLFETGVGEGEILTAIAFDAAPRSAYAKYPHPASHYPLVGVAVKLDVDGETIRAARIGVTGVGDTAFRSGPVEKALSGSRASDRNVVKAACAGAAAGVEARSDVAASAAYRSAMVDVYAARAVGAAAARGTG